jgi:short-subunit dehydrogenase
MKNILITGTSSGLGQIMANYLHKAGYNVTGTSRNVQNSNSKFQIIQLDVRDDDSVEKCVNEFIAANKTIDILINNAGNGIAGPIEDTSIAEAKEQLETNFFGLVRMNKAVLPYMRMQKHGLIINISSMGGLTGLPFQGFYAASKFAIEGYTEALRMEVKAFNINVVNVNPGDFKTNFTANRKRTAQLSDAYNSIYEQTLSLYEKDELNGANPELLAKLVLKLIKKEKGYKVRYLVGCPIQILGMYLKRFLGSRIFEKIMEGNYKI